MDSASVLKRTRRRSKDTLPAVHHDLDDDHDDEMSRLIARGRRLRERMELASRIDPDDANRPGSRTVLELDVLRNVPDSDIDTDVLFANLFFDQEGADAVAAAREHKRQSLQEIQQAQDEARQALNDIAGVEETAIRLKLLKLVFDSRFPFASSRPAINVTFLVSNNKNARGSAVTSSPTKFHQSKTSFQIDEVFSLILPTTAFSANDSYIHFMAKCECVGQQASKPRSVNMSGSLALYRLLASDQASTRDIDLISRNRQHRCTLKFELSYCDDEDRELERPRLPSDIPNPFEYVHPSPPKIAQGVPSTQPEPVAEVVVQSALAHDVSQLAVRPGDLVIVQVGIRSGSVTVSPQQRLRYLFVSYQVFPGQTRVRTAPSPDQCCPTFDHLGQIPRLYSDQFYQHLTTSLLVLELWLCTSPRPREGHHARLLGIAKVKLDRLLPALSQGGFSKEPSGDVFAAVKLCGFNGDVEVRDVITGKIVGQLSVMLALGSLPQMSLLGELWRSAVPIQRVARGFLCRRRLPGNIRPIKSPHKKTSPLVVEPVPENHGGDHSGLSSPSPITEPSAVLVAKDRSSDILSAPSNTQNSDVPSDHQEIDNSVYLEPGSADSNQVKTVERDNGDDSVGPFISEDSSLSIECHQAANLSDPDLFTGSLFLKFCFDPTPALPHQSGLTATNMVPGCSHPNWGHRVRLDSKVLPSPEVLLQEHLLFSLLSRFNERPAPHNNRCVGQARFPLQKLAVDGAENGILEWLDIISDTNQCIGHLLVRIIPNHILLSSLLEARSKTPFSVTRESASSLPLSYELCPERPVFAPLPDSFRFRSSISHLSDLDYSPIQEILCEQSAYQGPIVTIQDVNLKLKEFDGVRNDYQGAAATMQDLNLKLTELDDIKSRLENFQSYSPSTDSDRERSGARLRAPLMFTPNPKTSKPSSSVRVSTELLSPPARSLSPEQQLGRYLSPIRHPQVVSQTRPVTTPNRARSAPVKSPIRASSTPITSPVNPSSPVNVSINIVETLPRDDFVELERIGEFDEESSPDQFGTEILDIEITNIEHPIEAQVVVQNEAIYIKNNENFDAAPIEDDKKAEPFLIENNEKTLLFPEQDSVGHYFDEIEEDISLQNLIDPDVTVRDADDKHVRSHSNEPKSHNDSEFVINHSEQSSDINNQPVYQGLPVPESTVPTNQAADPVHDSPDTSLGIDDVADDKILSSPTQECCFLANTDSKLEISLITESNSSFHGAAFPSNRDVREVALSPIRVIPDPDESSLLSAKPSQSDDDDVRSFLVQETSINATAVDIDASDGENGVRSSSTTPVKSTLVSHRRMNLSYTTSPVTSRESSPAPVSDYTSFQSDCDDTDYGKSVGNLSPSTAIGLPPLPPKPRPQVSQVLTSADERKRYERIARIFEGRF